MKQKSIKSIRQPYWRNDIYYWKSELRVIGSYIDNPELLEVGE